MHDMIGKHANKSILWEAVMLGTIKLCTLCLFKVDFRLWIHDSYLCLACGLKPSNQFLRQSWDCTNQNFNVLPHPEYTSLRIRASIKEVCRRVARKYHLRATKTGRADEVLNREKWTLQLKIKNTDVSQKQVCQDLQESHSSRAWGPSTALSGFYHFLRLATNEYPLWSNQTGHTHLFLQLICQPWGRGLGSELSNKPFCQDRHFLH